MRPFFRGLRKAVLTGGPEAEIGGSEAGVERPVGAGGEGEAVAGIVVAADGVLLDVRGLDD